MSFDMAQFTQVFFDETKEHLATIEEVLLRLDVADPGQEDLNAIFRAAHSIKGGAGTFGFTDMADFTHVMETLLDRLRKQELTLVREMVDVLLEANDVIRSLLEAHQDGGEADPAQEADVRGRLDRFANGEGRAPAAAPVVEAPSPAPVQRFRIRFKAPADDAGVVNLLAELRGIGTLAQLETPGKGGSGARRGKSSNLWSLVFETGATETELRDLFGFVLSPDALEIALEHSASEDTAGDGGFGFFDDMPGAPGTDDGYGFFEPVGVATPEADQGYGFFDDQAVAAGTDAPGAAPADTGFGFFADAPGTPEAGAVAATRGEAEDAPAESAPDAGGSGTGPVAGRRATDQPGAPAAGGRRSTDARPAAGNGDSSIRVSVEKVDQLINLVGELVITQSMLAQAVSRYEELADEKLTNGIAQLERNSRDLQEAVMSIRMLPIAFVFSRFPRLVRDIASKLSKDVELKLVGEQTELDKGVIEKISDPLTHLVRNSLDHGLESTEDRVAAGKPAKGTITLKAFHQGGNIVIEVVDDGRGLDRNRILAKARARGMTVDDSMSDSDVFGLIFEAGFSTAEQVTDISGRGVGMDVVRRNIAALGGRVEIRSEYGKGCTVSIRLPLTLAILDGISVAVGASLYIVPLGYIVESLQPAAQDIKTISGTGLVMQVRGEYLPVVRLHEVMGTVPNVSEFHRGIMVILEADGARVAMFVDELVGQHQVVIKSLESNYRKVPGISAATIMGDGKVAMILDVAHLVRLGNPRRDYLQAA